MDMPAGHFPYYGDGYISYPYPPPCAYYPPHPAHGYGTTHAGPHPYACGGCVQTFHASTSREIRPRSHSPTGVRILSTRTSDDQAPPGSGRGDVEGANIGVQEPTHLPVSTAPPMDAFTAATPEPARTGAITGGLATASTAAVIAPMEENRGKHSTEGISASAALQLSTKKIGTEDHTMATDHATTNTAPATTAAATCKTTAEAGEEEPPLSELFRIEPSRDTHAKKAQVESLPLVLVDVRVVD